MKREKVFRTELLPIDVEEILKEHFRNIHPASAESPYPQLEAIRCHWRVAPLVCDETLVTVVYEEPLE